MRRVVVDLQNFLFADALGDALEEADSDFDVHKVENPDDSAELCRLIGAYALVMEVTASSPWLLSERLKIRDQVKEQNEDCKIVLLVNENADAGIANEVKQAKKDGLVDQFIYGSISSAYLSALIDTL